MLKAELRAKPQILIGNKDINYQEIYAAFRVLRSLSSKEGLIRVKEADVYNKYAPQLGIKNWEKEEHSPKMINKVAVKVRDILRTANNHSLSPKLEFIKEIEVTNNWTQPIKFGKDQKSANQLHNKIKGFLESLGIRGDLNPLGADADSYGHYTANLLSEKSHKLLMLCKGKFLLQDDQGKLTTLENSVSLIESAARNSRATSHVARYESEARSAVPTR